MTQVKVIIPIYSANISVLEKQSLAQACKVLKNYPLTVIKPESLDLSFLKTEFPSLSFESFDDEYFKGIPGYNRLMLSSELYDRFSDCEYILIYQLDAYVFNDDLKEWCEKDYDYVGAPWLQRPVYRLPFIAQWMKINLFLKKACSKPSKQSLYNKVGNGGLSLRKIKSHRAVLFNQRDKVDFYINQKRHHLYNEDVFWATEPEHFTYPSAQEALLFAFDKYPAYCLKLTNGKLPFGCHGWYKRKMKKFWMNVIPF